MSREIYFSSPDALSQLVEEITEKYLNGRRGMLSKYHDVIKYDGTLIDDVVYELDGRGVYLRHDFESLLACLAEPSQECKPLDVKMQASVIQGVLRGGADDDPEETPVKLISMRNPLTVLRHKFLMKQDYFREITDKVISLRTTIDVLIVKDHVYLSSLEGERLFNMERTYRQVCREKIEKINTHNIVSDFQYFEKYAQKGRNPRSFMSFNEGNLDFLSEESNLESVASNFNLKTIEGKFDSSSESNVEKIIKILCGKAVYAVSGDVGESAGMKPWE